jgi:hypothetical protein
MKADTECGLSSIGLVNAMERSRLVSSESSKWGYMQVMLPFLGRLCCCVVQQPPQYLT